MVDPLDLGSSELEFENDLPALPKDDLPPTHSPPPAALAPRTAAALPTTPSPVRTARPNSPVLPKQVERGRLVDAVIHDLHDDVDKARTGDANGPSAPPPAFGGMSSVPTPPPANAIAEELELVDPSDVTVAPPSAAAAPLTERDVLCERGFMPHEHPGNRWFRRSLLGLMPAFVAGTWSERSALGRTAVQHVRRRGGRFLRRRREEDGGLCDIGDKAATARAMRMLRRATRVARAAASGSGAEAAAARGASPATLSMKDGAVVPRTGNEEPLGAYDAAQPFATPRAVAALPPTLGREAAAAADEREDRASEAPGVATCPSPGLGRQTEATSFAVQGASSAAEREALVRPAEGENLLLSSEAIGAVAEEEPLPPTECNFQGFDYDHILDILADNDPASVERARGAHAFRDNPRTSSPTPNDNQHPEPPIVAPIARGIALGSGGRQHFPVSPITTPVYPRDVREIQSPVLLNLGPSTRLLSTRNVQKPCPVFLSKTHLYPRKNTQKPPETMLRSDDSANHLGLGQGHCQVGSGQTASSCLLSLPRSEETYDGKKRPLQSAHWKDLHSRRGSKQQKREEAAKQECKNSATFEKCNFSKNSGTPLAPFEEFPATATLMRYIAALEKKSATQDKRIKEFELSGRTVAGRPTDSPPSVITEDSDLCDQSRVTAELTELKAAMKKMAESMEAQAAYVTSLTKQLPLPSQNISESMLESTLQCPALTLNAKTTTKPPTMIAAHTSPACHNKALGGEMLPSNASNMGIDSTLDTLCSAATTNPTLWTSPTFAVAIASVTARSIQQPNSGNADKNITGEPCR